MRWGVLNETLAAACILESNILERATRTGKLYLWDPFCGSGSFLIEALMAFLEQPVRMMDNVTFPFEEWPIHKKDEYEKFKHDLTEFKKVQKHVDVQIIGSDISIRAIDTASKNMQHANLTALQEVLPPMEHPIINDPLTFAKHWPNNEEAGTLIDYSQKTRPTYLSLYHGPFDRVGRQLAPLTNDFKDFTLLANIPYGHQSAEKQRQSVTDT